MQEIEIYYNIFETTGARKSIKRRCDWKLIDLSERTFHFCELGQPLFLIGFARVSSGSTDFSLGLTVQRSAFSDDTTLAKPTRYFDDPDQFACDYFGRDFAFPLEIYGAREENAMIGGHPGTSIDWCHGSSWGARSFKLQTSDFQAQARAQLFSCMLRLPANP